MSTYSHELDDKSYYCSDWLYYFALSDPSGAAQQIIKTMQTFKVYTSHIDIYPLPNICKVTSYSLIGTI